MTAQIINFIGTVLSFSAGIINSYQYFFEGGDSTDMTHALLFFILFFMWAKEL